MDELIEFLQISLEKDFRYDDDVAVDKLREVISELASNRLDSPGRPPPDELPQRPFGMVPELTAREEAGMRALMTEREREFTAAAAKRREENETAAAVAHRSNAVGSTGRTMAEEDEDEDDGERSL